MTAYRSPVVGAAGGLLFFYWVLLFAFYVWTADWSLDGSWLPGTVAQLKGVATGAMLGGAFSVLWIVIRRKMRMQELRGDEYNGVSCSLGGMPIAVAATRARGEFDVRKLRLPNGVKVWHARWLRKMGRRTSTPEPNWESLRPWQKALLRAAGIREGLTDWDDLSPIQVLVAEAACATGHRVSEPDWERCSSTQQRWLSMFGLQDIHPEELRGVSSGRDVTNADSESSGGDEKRRGTDWSSLTWSQHVALAVSFAPRERLKGDPPPRWKRILSAAGLRGLGQHGAKQGNAYADLVTALISLLEAKGDVPAGIEMTPRLARGPMEGEDAAAATTRSGEDTKSGVEAGSRPGGSRERQGQETEEARLKGLPHGGHSLLEHSYSVASVAMMLEKDWTWEAAQAQWMADARRAGLEREVRKVLKKNEKFVYKNRNPLVPILGLAHDIGKMATFRQRSDGSWDKTREDHDSIAPLMLARMPEFWRLKHKERRILQFVLSTYHRPADLRRHVELVGLDDEIFCLQQLLIKADRWTGLLETDSKDQTEAEDVAAEDHDVHGEIWDAFCVLVSEANRIAADHNAFRIGQKNFITADVMALLLNELQVRKEITKRVSARVREMAEDRGGDSEGMTALLLETLASKGVLIRQTNGMVAEVSQAIWQVKFYGRDKKRDEPIAQWDYTILVDPSEAFPRLAELPNANTVAIVSAITGNTHKGVRGQSQAEIRRQVMNDVEESNKQRRDLLQQQGEAEEDGKLVELVEDGPKARPGANPWGGRSLAQMANSIGAATIYDGSLAWGPSKTPQVARLELEEELNRERALAAAERGRKSRLGKASKEGGRTVRAGRNRGAEAGKDVTGAYDQILEQVAVLVEMAKRGRIQGAREVVDFGWHIPILVASEMEEGAFLKKAAVMTAILSQETPGLEISGDATDPILAVRTMRAHGSYEQIREALDAFD